MMAACDPIADIAAKSNSGNKDLFLQLTRRFPKGFTDKPTEGSWVRKPQQYGDLTH